MKAERRHELQQNSLALWIRWRAPVLWEQYGTRILLGIIVISLGVVLIRWRLNAPIEAANRAAETLAEVNETIRSLAQADGRQLPGNTHNVPSDLRKAAEITDDPKLVTEAHLLEAEYYWALLNFPDPGASTQPAFRSELSHDELLNKAEAACQAALKIEKSQPLQAARAHLTLAAIAKTRAAELDRANKYRTPSDKNPYWASAKEHYEAVAKNEAVLDILRDEATQSIRLLTILQEPVWLEPPQPDTRPAATQLGPALPSTKPAIITPPASKPAK
jgi:hypothetical protein